MNIYIHIYIYIYMVCVCEASGARDDRGERGANGHRDSRALLGGVSPSNVDAKYLCYAS